MVEKITYPIALMGDFRDLAHLELVALNIGFNGNPLLLFAEKPLDYTGIGIGGVRFSKAVPKECQNYRLISFEGEHRIELARIQGEKFNIHHVQLLPDSRILLACSRSVYNSPERFEKNGRIYGTSGVFQSEILLGDGIEDVQATENGLIWTGFFDEGIFGNNGWDEPVGASGLVAFDTDGNSLYEFEPLAGLRSIDACYALNVPTADEAWCYYYIRFPIVKIQDRRIAGFWHSPVTSAHAFAVDGDFIMFAGASDMKDSYPLVKLQTDHRAEIIGNVDFIDENGQPLRSGHTVARGRQLFLIQNNKLYKADLRNILETRKSRVF